MPYPVAIQCARSIWSDGALLKLRNERGASLCRYCADARQYRQYGMEKTNHQRLITAVVVAAALSPVSVHCAAAQDVSGFWWAQKYTPALEIMGGGALPLNEAGRAQYEANMAGLRDGSLIDEARRHCLPDGVPRILGSPYPFRIVHTPGQTTIIHELNNVVRYVHMDRPLDPPDELQILPYYSGHSVGRWEDDTLVIETGGFNEKTFLDATGAPHSCEMSTVEHIRKLEDGTLEDVVTITDPVYYSEPFSARFVYDNDPGLRIQDYVCGEPHRDISHIPGVAEARANLRPFNR